MPLGREGWLSKGAAQGTRLGPFGIINREVIFANKTLQSYVGIEG